MSRIEDRYKPIRMAGKIYNGNPPVWGVWDITDAKIVYTCGDLFAIERECIRLNDRRLGHNSQ